MWRPPSGGRAQTVTGDYLDAAGDAFLLGTIHTDNLPSYRSAIASGRIDVGGEVLLDL